jgi:hypothetical protein
MESTNAPPEHCARHVPVASRPSTLQPIRIKPRELSPPALAPFRSPPTDSFVVGVYLIPSFPNRRLLTPSDFELNTLSAKQELEATALPVSPLATALAPSDASSAARSAARAVSPSPTPTSPMDPTIVAVSTVPITPSAIMPATSNVSFQLRLPVSQQPDQQHRRYARRTANCRC